MHSNESGTKQSALRTSSELPPSMQVAAVAAFIFGALALAEQSVTAQADDQASVTFILSVLEE
jgi:hypothetical protein